VYKRQVLIQGNAYARIIRRNTGDIEKFEYIPSIDVEVNISDRGNVFYKIPGRETRIPARDMIHIKGMGNGVIGRSVIDYQKNTFGHSIAVEQYGDKFFKEGDLKNVNYKHPGVLSETARKNLERSLKEEKGLAGAHKIRILEEGMEILRSTIPPEDAQFIETRKFNRTEIAAIFRVPPHMIGDLDHATFSNIEHQGMQYVQGCLTPWAVRLEQEFDRKIFTRKENLYNKLNFNSLLRADATGRANLYNTLSRIGVYTPNDILKLENMNPYDAGNDHYIQMQMIPVDQVRDNLNSKKDGNTNE